MRLAASMTVARTVRLAVEDLATRLVMTFAAALALGVAAVCLSCAAFILLARNIDPAAAWAIMGTCWGLGGVGYFAATRRRRI